MLLPALLTKRTNYKKGVEMKFGIFIGAAMFALLVVGFVNAGSSPRRITQSMSGGCASQVTYSYEATSGGCHSSPMVQPAYTDCGCAGGRVTLAERSQARRAARANYDKTHAAFLAAAAKGELISPVAGPELTTMKAAPVVEEVAECPCEDKCNCKLPRR